MFDCDSVWCCWLALLHGVGHVLWTLRWVALIYGSLYAVGAALFLLTLRIKSRDGLLIVENTSLAYAIAHPLRYGGHKSRDSGAGNICAFYATMFNMILFVWPVLVVYFILASTVGSVATLLFGSFWLSPDLREPGFMKVHELLSWPFALVTIPLVLIVLAVVNRARFLHGLKVAGWAILCTVPLTIVLLIVGILFYKLRHDGDGTSVSVMRE